jgi:hypothetical protein
MSKMKDKMIEKMIEDRDDAAGKRAYEAFLEAAQELLPSELTPGWEQLSKPLQDAWTAAAKAVIAGELCRGI